MKHSALTCLESLLKAEKKREKRLTSLLKRPEDEFTQGWYFCVPRCFNVALDIQLTERTVDGKKGLVWTQGSKFCFKEGDLLYDTSGAYQEWSKALKHIGICVKIIEATDVSPAQNDNERLPGSVKFKTLKPDEQKTRLVEAGETTMSQDEFIQFLITGPSITKKESQENEVEALDLFPELL